LIAGKINKERLRRRIEAVNEAGRDPQGGHTRLAFSEQDREARRLVEEMMREAGLEIEHDAAGNIFGSYKCGDLPGYVATGSHIDTVRNGGPFDGLLGSIAAIESLHCAKEQGILLKRPLRAIVFADEEGARFGSGLIGSKSIAGIPLPQPLDSYSDRDGVRLPDALKSFGLDPDKVLSAAAPKDTYSAFLELHIEQSAVLEQQNRQIGIVSGIKGVHWIQGSFTGESNHAGGTPMNMRHDALAAASKLVTEIYRIGCDLGNEFVATVGVLKITPGGINTIPGHVEYTIDIRDLDMARRSEGIRLILEAAEKAAAFYRVSHEHKCIKDEASCGMDISIINVLEEVCKDNQADYMILPSGPFHDTLPMATICKTGMIFVPSIGGISHSPKENTNWDDIYKGADILYHSLIRLARQ
jgi:allantoate deiminase